ncbi:MAG: site-2 protease family protein, partial [archaeon]
ARFSKIELKHLAVSIGVMSLAVAWNRDWNMTLFMLIPSLIILAPAFAFHELAHKFAAQKYGFFAEYRMWKNGLIAALAMAVITTLMGSKFLFIAPGAVYFSGRHAFHGTMEEIGKIGFAGPITNIGMVAIFGLISLLSTNALVAGIATTGVYVNAFLAVFNLIPFGPLDGKKVLSWNRTYWGVALAIGLSALLFAEVLI